MAPMSPCRLLLACVVLALPGAAVAGTAYRCVAADGAVTYRDTPCPASQKQQAIPLDDDAAAPSPMPASTAPEAPRGMPAPSPAPRPTAPLPVLYACQRATDGTSYLSRNGDPQPYQAPFGVLGAVQMPLGAVYGPGGAGASAPELNRGRVTSGLVARHYVWVQDRCRPMGPQETCDALRDAYDENEHKLKQAFESERGPYEKREAELEAQLTHC